MSPLLYRFCLPALALIPVACDRSPDGPTTITEMREISQFEPAPEAMSNRERFTDSPLRFKVPEGWKSAPATMMRQMNFTFGPDSQGECYLTISPQAMGGVTENVNRWRKQMGLPPVTENDVAKLPLKNFLIGKAFYIDLSGDYTGAMIPNGPPPEKKTDYRMLTMYLPTPQLTFIVKMVGPAKEVAAEEGNFLKFCESLKMRR